MQKSEKKEAAKRRLLKKISLMLLQSRFCTVPAHADCRRQSDLGGSLPKQACQQSNRGCLDHKRAVSFSSQLPGPELEPQTAELWCMDAEDDGRALLLQTTLQSDPCE